MAYTHPGIFVASEPSVSPTVAATGETVTISVLVTNTGDIEDTHQVVLKIDNIVEATKDITLAGHASQKVTFTTTKDVVGTYTVNINGLSSTFEVKAAPKAINWQLLGGIIAAVIVAIVVPLVIRRRRTA